MESLQVEKSEYAPVKVTVEGRLGPIPLRIDGYP